MTLAQIESAMEIACDEICKFPGEFDDIDDMYEQKCEKCPLAEFLNTLEDDDE